MSVFKSSLSFLWVNFQKMPTIYKLWFLYALVLGSYVRYINLNNFGYYYDTISTQYSWAKSGFEMSYFGFWKNYPDFFDYLPFSLIYEIFIYSIAKVFGGGEVAYIHVLKSFNWLSELILTFFTIYVVLKEVEKLQKLKQETINWIFNLGSIIYIAPSLWFVTALWGQIDSLIPLITWISIYLLYLGHENQGRAQVPFYRDCLFWSGIIFGIAFWTKQQSVLTLPVLFIFYLSGKNWKLLGKAAVRIGLNIILSVLLNGLGVLYGMSQNLVSFGTVNGLWYFNGLDFILKYLPYTISLNLLVILWQLLNHQNQKTTWQQLIRQIFGFTIFSSLIVIPLLFVNIARFGTTLFAVASRDNLVTKGGHTFWSIFYSDEKDSYALLSLGPAKLSISIAGYLAYFALMGVLLYFFYKLNFQDIWTDLKSLSAKLVQTIRRRPTTLYNWHVNKIFTKPIRLVDFALLMTINCSLYFFFFTKIHSRYLHFAIVFSLISLIFLVLYKGWRWFLLILVFFHLGYFINQVNIQGDGNSIPQWPRDFVNYEERNYTVYWWKTNAKFLSLSFFVLYIHTCYLFRQEKLLDKN